MANLGIWMGSDGTFGTAALRRFMKLLTTKNLRVDFAPAMYPNFSKSTVMTLRPRARVTACALASAVVGACGDLRL